MSIFECFQVAMLRELLSQMLNLCLILEKPFKQVVVLLFLQVRLLKPVGYIFCTRRHNYQETKLSLSSPVFSIINRLYGDILFGCALIIL